ncbi:MAG: sugar phosphate isomerase/epimerase [Salinarimonas sp.]|nr:sugar phosphate isomerase/epimerase [Salinarimonas sp.]
MTLPRLGVALNCAHFDTLRDWVLDSDRTIEIQDFVHPSVIGTDHSDLIAQWRERLAGHRGLRGIHGPFFSLDIAAPDPAIRAVVQERLMAGLDVAGALGATHMVIHSPFTFWHTLNYANFTYLRSALFEATAECLAPVLARAADIECTVMLENIDDTDPRDRTELVATIDHPNLMVSLDTGHAELAHGRYGAPPVVDFIAASAERLGHVHLQDADGYADRHWHPGDGLIPWRPVFSALAACAQAPRLILEVHGEYERLPDSVARLEAMGLAC